MADDGRDDTTQGSWAPARTRIQGRDNGSRSGCGPPRAMETGPPLPPTGPEALGRDASVGVCSWLRGRVPAYRRIVLCSSVTSPIRLGLPWQLDGCGKASADGESPAGSAPGQAARRLVAVVLGLKGERLDLCLSGLGFDWGGWFQHLEQLRRGVSGWCQRCGTAVAPRATRARHGAQPTGSDHPCQHQPIGRLVGLLQFLGPPDSETEDGGGVLNFMHLMAHGMA